MGRRYSSSDSRIIAYDNALQEMHGKRIAPDPLGLYWGDPQVIKLTEKITGSPIEPVHPYPTKEKIKGNTQYNNLAHCRVKLAKQHIKASTKMHYKVFDLFNLQSIQESYNDKDNDHVPAFSPPRKHHKPYGNRKHPPWYHNNKVAARVKESEHEFGGKQGYMYLGSLFIHLLSLY
jgi:hypothetical protein